MPDYSIKLPYVSEVAITKAKEILAFSTLPYYQVSGVLKDEEGAVAIGDPIAWDAVAREFIVYDGTGTVVAAEAVGTGDGSIRIWSLINGRIKRGSYAIQVNAVAQVEWDDYTIDLRTGVINFFVAPPNTELITADYSYFDGSAKETCVGFVRIPGDSSGAVVISTEAVGDGDGATVDFELDHALVKPGSVTIEVADDGVDLVEGVDYLVNYTTGAIHFVVAPENGKAITADYTYYTSIDVAKGTPIEVVIGGAVKYAIVAAATNWEDDILDDLGAKYWEIADALIW